MAKPGDISEECVMADVVTGIACAVDIMTDDFTNSDGELVDMIHDVTGTDCVVVVMIDDVTGTGCEVDVMVDDDTGSIWKKSHRIVSDLNTHVLLFF